MGYSPWGHKESDTTEATQHAQRKTRYTAKEFTFLLRMGRYMPLGSPNSFLSYVPQLSRAKSCFLIAYILNSLFTIRNGRCSGWLLLAFPTPPPAPQQSPQGASNLLDSRHCIPFGEPSFTFGSPKITDDCDISCPLIWQEVFHSTRASLVASW